MKSRWLPAILALCLVLCLLPGNPAQAVENSGNCGASVSWTLDEAGTLTISGTGPMADYYGESAPWYDFATHSSPVKKVIISDGVTRIGNNAFNNCAALEEVTIPDSVTSIGSSTFRFCSALKAVVIPNSVTKIEDYAFSSCTSLRSLVLPSSTKGVITIGENAFCNCSALTCVNIPDGIKEIPYGMFCDCANLREVRIGAQVELIGKAAFLGCSSLVNLVLPDKVWKIDDYAFQSCGALSVVTLGKNVGTIGLEAFDNCPALYKVINYSGMSLKPEDCFNNTNYGLLMENVKVLLDADGNITYPQDDWFGEWVLTEDKFLFFVSTNGSGSLYAYLGEEETVTLPESFNGNSYTISGCRGAKNIIVPNTFTSIPYNAFENAAELVSISIPGSVKTIESSAFRNCVSLTEVKLENGLESIDGSAFLYCRRLTSIWIPSSVTYISNDLWRNGPFDSENWWHVLYEGTQEQWESMSVLTEASKASFHYNATGSEITSKLTAEPTCIQEGTMTHSCSVCNTSVTTGIPTVDHTWKNATCTDPQTCTACKTTVGSSLSGGKDHTWDKGTLTKEATCGEAGEMTYTCTVCSDTKAERVDATGEHAYDDSKDATCNTCGHKREVAGGSDDSGNDSGSQDSGNAGNNAGNAVDKSEVSGNDDSQSPGGATWIIIVVVVVAVGAVAVILILKKKSAEK